MKIKPRDGGKVWTEVYRDRRRILARYAKGIKKEDRSTMTTLEPETLRDKRIRWLMDSVVSALIYEEGEAQTAHLRRIRHVLRNPDLVETELEE